MFDRRTLVEPGGWTGYRVADLEHRPGEGWMGRGKLLIGLKPRGETMRCSRCGKQSRLVHGGYARRLWEGWAPLMQFARRLEPCLKGILAHCRHPLHTSVLEGINNRIKVIRRMACGFRDTDCFFLKIREAFPGNLR